MPYHTIRTRRATDLDKCIDALRAVHDADAYPLNWPADPHGWLTPPRLLRAWIAQEPGGTIAGHVAVQHLPSASDSQGTTRHAEVSRLYVIPAARRRSVASALVRQVRLWAAEQGYDLTLNVTDEHRSAAVAFYDATGWQHIHTTDADWTDPDGRPVRLRHYTSTAGTPDAGQKGSVALSEGADRRPQDFHEESADDGARGAHILLFRALDKV